MNLEEELRIALRREPADSGFSGRVLARTRVHVWRRPAVLALAAGLAVVSLVPRAVLEHERRGRERGLEAKRELLVALSITRNKLQQVRREIQRNSGHTL